MVHSGPGEMRLDLGEAILRPGAVSELGMATFSAISLAIQVLRGPDIPQLLEDKVILMLFKNVPGFTSKHPALGPPPSHGAS